MTVKILTNPLNDALKNTAQDTKVRQKFSYTQSAGKLNVSN